MGPDGESAQWVAQAQRHGLQHAVLPKSAMATAQRHHRPAAAGRGGRPWCCSTIWPALAIPLAQATRLLLQAGAASVDVAVTHALIAPDALTALHEAGVGCFWSTDCVAHASNAVASGTSSGRGWRRWLPRWSDLGTLLIAAGACP